MLPARVPFNLLPADALLLGEQHDADAQQRIQAEVVRRLAWRDQLAALALEMVEQGHGTQHLLPDADENAVRAALQWNEESWPWARYREPIMAAVDAGVPVIGANLPRDRMRLAMLQSDLDASVPPPALAAQREAIRVGHCGLLAPEQIPGMTRIQIARDQAMARTLQQAERARPGRTVVLLAGSGHVDRRVGVPLHLAPGFTSSAVRLLAAPPDGADTASEQAGFDAVWTTPAAPAKDHCAELRQRFGR